MFPHLIGPQVIVVPSSLAPLPHLPVSPTLNILSLPIQSLHLPMLSIQSCHSQWLLQLLDHKIFHDLISSDLDASHLQQHSNYQQFPEDTMSHGLCACCSLGLECPSSHFWLGELLHL